MTVVAAGRRRRYGRVLMNRGDMHGMRENANSFYGVESLRRCG